MKTRTKIAAFLIVGLLSLWTRLEGALDAGEIEKLVRQWLDLREELMQVENDWKRQSRLLSDELRLLEKQREQLARSVESRHAGIGELEAKLERGRKDEEALAGALADLHDPLISVERALKPWLRRLPPFMIDPLREGLSALPGHDAPEDANALARRMRAVIGLSGQLEQLNCSIHAQKLILVEPGGDEQEMDVVFLGLAIAFAVSPDDALAAVGRFGPEGLAWEWDATLAPSVRRLWTCYRKETPAKFVSLPLTTEAGE